MPVRCLSVHVPYVCAHSGACCRAGWAIPVQETLIEPLRAIGLLVGPDRVAPTRESGECAFFEPEAGNLCAIHRRAGASLLPSVCRHFPRVIVNDPRGASVTLSHFCPTAAGLLFTPTRLAIVEAPRAVALEGALEGLDATSVLPPLLAPGVLTDWDGYSAWEEAAVAVFNVDGAEPEQAVDRLKRATDDVSGWRPGGEPLSAHVRRVVRGVISEGGGTGCGNWAGFARPVNAFLAAHAFASWAAYEPDGLRAIPEAVSHALAILRHEVEQRGDPTQDSLLASIRAADLELRHRKG
jgi:hypothetical protein